MRIFYAIYLGLVIRHVLFRVTRIICHQCFWVLLLRYDPNRRVPAARSKRIQMAKMSPRRPCLLDSSSFVNKRIAVYNTGKKIVQAPNRQKSKRHRVPHKL